MSGDEEEHDILPQTRLHPVILAIQAQLLDEGVRRRCYAASQTMDMSKEEIAKKLKDFDDSWIKHMNTELDAACRRLEAFMVRMYNLRRPRYEDL